MIIQAFSRAAQFAAASAALIAISNVAGEAAGREPVEGKAVPAFSMKTTAGRTVTNKTLKGKVVLLDFWATWCGPCKAASPLVQKLHKQFGSKGFVAIGANTFEQGNAMTAAKKYAADHKYSYLFTYNNDKLSESWGITGIPYFVLIDKKGKVAKIYRGYDSSIDAEMSKMVAKLVAK